MESTFLDIAKAVWHGSVKYDSVRFWGEDSLGQLDSIIWNLSKITPARTNPLANNNQVHHNE